MIDFLLILILILTNGIFAMAEIALVSAKKVRLQSLADKGNKGAVLALKLQDKPGYFLSTIQVGITTISILSGIIGEKSLILPVTEFYSSFDISPHLVSTLSNFTVIFLLTFLSVVLGEIIPKSIALTLSDKISSALSIPMSWFTRLFFPFIWIFDTSSKIILKVLKLNKFEVPPISNEEIKELMGQGTEAGVFHESEQQLVANVLHMDERSASSIMTHRGEWKYIDLADDFQVNKVKLIDNKISKILCVSGDINNIVGYVHITDILGLLCSEPEFNIKDYIKDITYLPQTVTASQVLEHFKVNHVDISIVINEYGENIGIITVSDIMSALVGDIEDEPLAEDRDIVQREDGSYLVVGLISLDKLCVQLVIEKFNSFAEVNTLSGFIMAIAGAVPQVGFIYELDLSKQKVSFEVMDMDKNCVDKVLLIITPKEIELN